ncbi:sirohydrochlorin cobaltochelatase [Polaromonas sp. YR568]|uniref:sirohydrochlorin chelatase n=1 Tax=Polaromonas sp. YR568 TaxID=1855301 RepID=UPI0008E193F9|nr:CbiX/SirB N-terminal domain-containing protein [Polaromonas sp. YR568]SFV02470.1 sirohydrochlorin cobaltochelatase [Polaromonas sp. YR568]
MPSTPATRGIILLAHGSRDPQWRAPIEAVAAQIRAQAPGTPVRCAYLELCAPSLPEAATDLVAAHASSIRVFPLFFGVGKHAREDLPLLVEQIRASHPDVEVELLPTAGEYRELTALMAGIALA